MDICVVLSGKYFYSTVNGVSDSVAVIFLVLPW